MSSFLMPSFGFNFGAGTSITKAEKADTRLATSSALSSPFDPVATSPGRSTSAGSTPQTTARSGTSTTPASSARREEAPSPYIVKNTFIDGLVDGPSARPFSLEGFFKERQVQSCPQSRNASLEDAPLSSRLVPTAEDLARRMERISECPKKALNEESNVFDTYDAFEDMRDVKHSSGKESSMPNLDTIGTLNSSSTTLTSASTALPAPRRSAWAQKLGSTSASTALPATSLPRSAWAHKLGQVSSSPPPALPGAGGNNTFLLQLSEVLPQSAQPLCQAPALPELGSPEFPSLGSVGHNVGACNPCVFFHVRGCAAAHECDFCHLCDSEEKKRRKAVKKELRKAGIPPPHLRQAELAEMSCPDPFDLPLISATTPLNPLPLEASQAALMGSPTVHSSTSPGAFFAPR